MFGDKAIGSRKSQVNPKAKQRNIRDVRAEDKQKRAHNIISSPSSETGSLHTRSLKLELKSNVERVREMKRQGSRQSFEDSLLQSPSTIKLGSKQSVDSLDETKKEQRKASVGSFKSNSRSTNLLGAKSEIQNKMNFINSLFNELNQDESNDRFNSKSQPIKSTVQSAHKKESSKESSHSHKRELPRGPEKDGLVDQRSRMKREEILQNADDEIEDTQYRRLPVKQNRVPKQQRRKSGRNGGTSIQYRENLEELDDNDEDNDDIQESQNPAKNLKNHNISSFNKRITLEHHDTEDYDCEATDNGQHSRRQASPDEEQDIEELEDYSNSPLRMELKPKPRPNTSSHHKRKDQYRNQVSNTDDNSQTYIDEAEEDLTSPLKYSKSRRNIPNNVLNPDVLELSPNEKTCSKKNSSIKSAHCRTSSLKHPNKPPLPIKGHNNQKPVLLKERPSYPLQNDEEVELEEEDSLAGHSVDPLRASSRSLSQNSRNKDYIALNKEKLKLNASKLTKNYDKMLKTLDHDLKPFVKTLQNQSNKVLKNFQELKRSPASTRGSITRSGQSTTRSPHRRTQREKDLETSTLTNSVHEKSFELMCETFVNTANDMKHYHSGTTSFRTIVFLGCASCCQSFQCPLFVRIQQTLISN